MKPEDAPHGDYFPQNFYITSTDLKDPSTFSDPIFYDFYGIDPSVYFENDRAYVQGSFMLGYEKKHQATTIKQVEIDIKTGKHLSDMKEIWEGHSGIIPEGPHIYNKDGYYYLLVAEGGTFDGHMLTMARAKSIWGPYEPCPNNPVIRANTVCPLIQRIGHGELVFDDTTDTWWATVLAARSGGRSSFPLGRETFLTSVEWPENDWPRFIPVEETIQLREPLKKLKAVKPERVMLGDTKTVFLRTPQLDHYQQDVEKLILTPVKETLSVMEGTTTFLGQRQYHLDSHAKVELHFPKSRGESLQAGITVYKDTNRHFSLFLDISNGKNSLMFEVESIDSSGPQRVASIELSQQDIQLSIKSTVERYEFYYDEGLGEKKIGEAEGRLLSGNDFTGAIYAIFANGSWKQSVTFENFIIT